MSNAAELSGPQGKSFLGIRAFMDGLGPYWFPVELDPFVVIGREKEGKASDQCCFCDRFLKDYTSARWGKVPPGEIIGVSDETFALGHLMDWVAPQRDSIARGKRASTTP